MDGVGEVEAGELGGADLEFLNDFEVPEGAQEGANNGVLFNVGASFPNVDVSLVDQEHVGGLAQALGDQEVGDLRIHIDDAREALLLLLDEAVDPRPVGGLVTHLFGQLGLGRIGLLARLFRPLFRLISRSWQMYPLGFLFGLGFDTATEIGLLGISAAQGSQGLPLWSILIFPLLFTAGMSLIDTTDGVLMIGAYGWAFVKPIRKLYYNMTITFVSVLVALLIGGVEGLGLLGSKLNLDGPFWQGVYALNENFGMLGYVIIALFAACWLLSAIVYRLKRYDEVQVNLR